MPELRTSERQYRKDFNLTAEMDAFKEWLAKGNTWVETNELLLKDFNLQPVMYTIDDIREAHIRVIESLPTFVCESFSYARGQLALCQLERLQGK